MNMQLLPFQGYYGTVQSFSNQERLTDVGDSSSSSRSKSPIFLNLKSAQTSHKHALSERNRRKRINRHYETLRQLFPNLLKTDKASVLTETVRRLKQLREVVTLLQQDDDGERRRFMPGENDESTVSYCEGGSKSTVRVTVCCEDRPRLNRDLAEAVQSVRGKAVKAEMATVGGRTKAVVVVQWPEGEEDVGSLKRASRAFVENRAMGFSGLVGHQLPDPKLAGLGPEFIYGKRVKICDSLKDGLADGLILRSV